MYGFVLMAKWEEKTGDIQHLVFSEKEYNERKLNEREFLYNNNMFDILSVKKEKQQYFLTCIQDKKEKDFLERLMEGIKQTKTKKCLAFSLLCDACVDNSFDWLLQTKQVTVWYSYSENQLKKYSLIDAPPPKI